MIDYFLVKNLRFEQEAVVRNNEFQIEDLNEKKLIKLTLYPKTIEKADIKMRKAHLRGNYQKRDEAMNKLHTVGCLQPMHVLVSSSQK